MKRSTKYLSGMFLGLVLTVSAVPGSAQVARSLKVTVPFNFVVANKEFKAGDYVIEREGETGFLIIRSKDDDGQQIVCSIPKESNKTGNHERLIFHRYGNEHFLAQIWFSSDEGGHELIRGAQEKTAAANESASNQAVAGQ